MLSRGSSRFAAAPKTPRDPSIAARPFVERRSSALPARSGSLSQGRSTEGSLEPTPRRRGSAFSFSTIEIGVGSSKGTGPSPAGDLDVVQRMQVGWVPNNAWRTGGNIRNHAGYTGLLPAHTGDDVGDFSTPTKNAVAASSAAGAGLGGVLPPAAPGGPAPISDHSNTQLDPRPNAERVMPEIDHIVPFAQWGSNDVRNARVLSTLENRVGGPPARPGAAQRDLIALENDPYNAIPRGGVLTLPDVNHLLTNFAGVAPVGGIAALTPGHLQALWNIP